MQMADTCVTTIWGQASFPNLQWASLDLWYLHKSHTTYCLVKTLTKLVCLCHEYLWVTTWVKVKYTLCWVQKRFTWQHHMILEQPSPLIQTAIVKSSICLSTFKAGVQYDTLRKEANNSIDYLDSHLAPRLVGVPVLSKLFKSNIEPCIKQLESNSRYPQDWHLCSPQIKIMPYDSIKPLAFYTYLTLVVTSCCRASSEFG